MRGMLVLLGIAVLAGAVSAVVSLLLGDPSGAVAPGLVAVSGGIALFKTVMNPPEPQPWRKARIIVSAVVGGAMTIAVVAALARVAVIADEWSGRLMASVGIVVALAIVAWAVRTVIKLDRQARETA